MEGYDVVTTDDDKVGRVIGRRDGFLIVETGHVLKHKYAIPETVAHTDEDRKVVRITVSRDLVHDSPKVSDDDFDELAVSTYYGLVPNEAADGEGRSAAEENERLGIQSADQRRAEIQTHPDPSSGTNAGPGVGRAASQRLERP
jgi:hypothetical protein